MTSTTAQDRRDALVERLFGATLGTLELFGVYLGDRLGLYRALAGADALDPDELARRAGIAPRYAHEWLEQQAVAGILETTPEMGDFPPSWDVYFASDDVDATAEKAVAAGGKVLREPFDIPGVGRMSVLQDPHGAVFEVIAVSMPLQR